MYIVILLFIIAIIWSLAKYLYEIGGYPLVIAVVAILLFLYIRLISREKKKSFYVSAQGDDDNSGKSEKRPFKTLGKAILAVNESRRRKITIIGNLNSKSEYSSKDDRYAIFDIFYTKNRDLTITGKPEASDKERAILSGVRGISSIVRIRGTSSAKIIFENIEISGIAPPDPDSYCSCVEVSLGTVEIGNGTIIKRSNIEGIRRVNDKIETYENDNGAGICITDGKLILNGGEITENKGSGIDLFGEAELSMIDGVVCHNGFGICVHHATSNCIISGGKLQSNQKIGIIVIGKCTMTDGSIERNEIGIVVSGKGKISIEGGLIEENKTGVYLTENGSLEISNGQISKNIVAGIDISDNGSFTENGGTISENGENILRH